ncbi:hypothetical protein [Pelistega europaea]|uniref:Lipoprotein n=1 Tax=Pelistega europaea TaxID=106147 RepID=A0A7Y4L7T9_9BURK|nr:hypothetical protein [Pelistega europaea]NOL48574.1 hypothetical protein [Pelistega europaea]
MKALKFTVTAGVIALLAGCGGSMPESCEKMLASYEELLDSKEASVIASMLPSKETMVAELEKMDEDMQEKTCSAYLHRMKDMDQLKNSFNNLLNPSK